MYDIEDAFEKHIERLRSLDYNILEVMMTNVISSAFDSASTVASGVELLESFASVAKRPSMKTVLNRKTADVFSMLASPGSLAELYGREDYPEDVCLTAPLLTALPVS
uniref:Dynein heavy chain tail domain-containing protein n=1 Tax=Spongospora subterranea TaxID=70186 RepID=A0A0H5RBI4_9EUKA|eukprot:CRZ10987.1 hypothetical protein [Spongospora subterranea]